jgi:hypothetical protein
LSSVFELSRKACKRGEQAKLEREAQESKSSWNSQRLLSDALDAKRRTESLEAQIAQARTGQGQTAERVKAECKARIEAVRQELESLLFVVQVDSQATLQKLAAMQDSLPTPDQSLWQMPNLPLFALRG